MNETTEKLISNLKKSVENKQTMIADSEQIKMFGEIVAMITEAYRRGGRLYVAGNGGSAADAQHLAAELVCKLGRSRRALPAEALTVDTSIITAIGNDFSFDEVFSRQIEGKMRTEDVFLALTTSGNSKNLLLAFETCKRMGIKTVLLSGRGGGKAKELADFTLVAPGSDSSQVQEVQLVLYHTLCGCLEDSLCN